VILRTIDAGATWTALNPRPVPNKLNSVYMVSEKEAWIVGNYSTILHSSDGGASWDVISSNADLSRITFVDANNGWVVGLSGTISRTTNGGKTWFEQNSGNVFELFGVGFVSPTQGYVVGSNATLIETFDGGNSWQIFNDPSDEGHGTAKRIVFDDPMTSWKSAMGFYNLHFPTPTHGWGVGESGKIAHTSDGGKKLVPTANI